MTRYPVKNIKLFYFICGILVAVAALILGINLLLGGRYVDLTADKKFSLSPQTLELLQRQEATIRLYVSKDIASPRLAGYASYVRRLLSEYQRKSGGRVRVNIIKVEPFSSSQASAEKAGITPFYPEKNGVPVYFGVSVTNATGRTLTIAHLIPERQKALESDMSRLLSVSAVEKQPRIGVLSSYFRVANGANVLDYAENKPFVKELEARGFEIIPLSSTAAAIPEGIDVVLVFYPLNLGQEAIYALDQYLMWGGKIIMMLDVFSEERFRDLETYISYNSGLRDFLQNSGVSYQENVLVGDNVNSRSSVLDGHYIKYPFWLTVTESHIAKHPITEGIKTLFLNYSGFFDYLPQDNLKMTVLFTTGSNSGLMKAENVAAMDYDKLSEEYVPTNKEYPLALLLEGKFLSLFDQPLIEDRDMLSILPPFLSLPIKEGALLIVGDSDMAAEFLWNDDMTKDTPAFETAFSSDNIYFLQNMLDYLSQSGYVSVPVKREDSVDMSLAAYFYQSAAARYLKSKAQIADKKIIAAQEVAQAGRTLAAVSMPSAKRLKELEQLQRELSAADEALRRIDYQTKENYNDYLSLFAWVTIILLPAVFILAIGVGYRCYEIRIKRKAEEYVK